MHRQKKRRGAFLIRSLFILVDLYLIGILVWINLHNLFADRWWWLFSLNSFAIYLFIPLPLTIIIALLSRRAEHWLGNAAVLLIWLMLYGELFIPRQPRARASAPTLTVMTYNMYGYNQYADRVVETIRAADADLIAIQELSSAAANAIEQELHQTYPYQIFDIRGGVSGMGVISRYPLTAYQETLAGEYWVGPPQVLTLKFHDTSVTILNVHAMATGVRSPAMMEATIGAREEQARVIVEFIAARDEPLILLGDLNVTDRNHAYELIAAHVEDAWRAAGWGTGHTFTNAMTPGNAPARVTGIPALDWLVRIDYVFHSTHWRAAEARIGLWDKISDHRPVVATLAFTPQ